MTSPMTAIPAAPAARHSATLSGAIAAQRHDRPGRLRRRSRQGRRARAPGRSRACSRSERPGSRSRNRPRRAAARRLRGPECAEAPISAPGSRKRAARGSPPPGRCTPSAPAATTASISSCAITVAPNRWPSRTSAASSARALGRRQILLAQAEPAAAAGKGSLGDVEERPRRLAAIGDHQHRRIGQIHGRGPTVRRGVRRPGALGRAAARPRP